MITQDILEQYLDLKREIKQLEQDLSKARKQAVHDSVQGSQTDWPYIQQTIPVHGVNIQKSETLQKILEQRLLRLQYQTEAIERWIDTIDNSQIRQIIQCRYIKGYSWQRVAIKIGRHDEQYPRKKLKKFLECTKSTN